MSATSIRLFSRDKVKWILQVHILFQMYCYADKLGLAKDVRDIYGDHKLFDAAVKFCQNWNQIPSVPEYKNELSYFEPTTIQQHS